MHSLHVDTSSPLSRINTRSGVVRLWSGSVCLAACEAAGGFAKALGHLNVPPMGSERLVVHVLGNTWYCRFAF